MDTFPEMTRRELTWHETIAAIRARKEAEAVRDYQRRSDAGEDLTPTEAACELAGLIVFVVLFVAVVAGLGYLAIKGIRP